MTGNDDLPEPDDYDFGALLADRDTLREVTEELIGYRVAARMVAESWSPRTRARIRSREVAWVKVDVRAARALLDLVDPVRRDDRVTEAGE